MYTNFTHEEIRDLNLDVGLIIRNLVGQIQFVEDQLSKTDNENEKELLRKSYLELIDRQIYLKEYNP